jgi:putative ABC transport system substrate-binding protein
MRRREFITLLGGAATWPLRARAQQPAMPIVGFLHIGSPGPFARLVTAFRQGMSEAGFFEGQNVQIEYHWAEGRYDRLPDLAAELVRRPVAVLAAFGGEPSVLAAKAATSTIPIVFLMGGDPVAAGVVDSLNHPGANVTGFSFLTERLEPKRLGLLRELVPNAATIGVLVDSSFPPAGVQIKDAEDAVANFGARSVVLRVKAEIDLDAAFATLSRERADALLVCASPSFNNRRDLLVALAARNRCRQCTSCASSPQLAD